METNNASALENSGSFDRTKVYQQYGVGGLICVRCRRRAGKFQKRIDSVAHMLCNVQ